MPRNAIAFRLLVLLAIVASIGSSGCTAIGFGAGALIDMYRGKGPASRLDGVRIHSKVTIWMRDGRELHGVFAGKEESSAAAPTTAQPAGTDSLAAPHGAVILLETHEGVQRVPADDVGRVSVPVRSGKVIGSLLGLGVDIIWLVGALESFTAF